MNWRVFPKRRWRSTTLVAEELPTMKRTMEEACFSTFCSGLMSQREGRVEDNA